MDLIFAFIAAYMGFLWKGARYQISGSEVAVSNGGDAWLAVESDTLRMRFVCDRRQLLLDLQPVHTTRPSEWFGHDLLPRLLLGKRPPSGLLDESSADFLREHLADIESRFDTAHWPETRKQLKDLERKRSKEMFG